MQDKASRWLRVARQKFSRAIALWAHKKDHVKGTYRVSHTSPTRKGPRPWCRALGGGVFCVPRGCWHCHTIGPHRDRAQVKGPSLRACGQNACKRKVKMPTKAPETLGPLQRSSNSAPWAGSARWNTVCGPGAPPVVVLCLVLIFGCSPLCF